MAACINPLHPLRRENILQWWRTGHLHHRGADDPDLSDYRTALPFQRYWQMDIITGTTIVTFLMVFLIQNTQNRDSGVLQIKLDGIIRAIGTANNSLPELEEMDDDVLDRIREQYAVLARKERKLKA
jgi:hypothetical protein